MNRGSDTSAVKSAIKRDRHIQAARKLARVQLHTDPDAKTQRHTARLERSLATWIKYFGQDSFFWPFSENHKKYIKNIERCINEGGQVANAMPRGEGKTTIARWAVLYALLTGGRKSVVFVAATDGLATDSIDFVKRQLEENDLLHLHYPHVTSYIRASEGKALKAKYMLRADLESARLYYSADIVTLPTVTTYGQETASGERITKDRAQGYPSNGATMRFVGIMGAVRGRTKTGDNAAVIRPDLVILDDVQTRESAESPTQTATHERIINGGVLGLAWPDVQIAAIMPCTIIKKGDLSHRYLDRKLYPQWRGLTTAMVVKWPEAQETLWREYADHWRYDQDNDTNTATAFYRKNRRAMDKGAVVGWKHRKRRGELSALQTAQNLLLDRGDQFWAEYQNDPVAIELAILPISVELITSRVDTGRPPGIVPPETQTIVAFTDINRSYALTTTIMGFKQHQIGQVLWYGTHPLKSPNTDSERVTREKVHTALAVHGAQLATMPCRPDAWGIDGGGTPKNTVIDFCANSPRLCGLTAYTVFGRAAKQYHTRHRKNQMARLYEEQHLMIEGRGRQWIVSNADFWREVAQKGWTATPGGPGSCTLPEGHHNEFDEQICREVLRGKSEMDGQTIWLWGIEPGKNDYGDTVTGCYQMAAFMGIGTGIEETIGQTRGRKRLSQADLERR